MKTHCGFVNWTWIVSGGFKHRRMASDIVIMWQIVIDNTLNILYILLWRIGRGSCPVVLSIDGWHRTAFEYSTISDPCHRHHHQLCSFVIWINLLLQILKFALLWYFSSTCCHKFLNMHNGPLIVIPPQDKAKPNPTWVLSESSTLRCHII